VCEAGCEVLVEHGVGISSKHEDKKSRRCRAPILDVSAAHPWSRGKPESAPPRKA